MIKIALAAALGAAVVAMPVAYRGELDPVAVATERQHALIDVTVRVEIGAHYGSGTFITRRHVLTNAHVAKLAEDGKVTLRGWITLGGRVVPVSYDGIVRHVDEDVDLALVELAGPDEWAGEIAQIAPAGTIVWPGEAVYVAGGALKRRPHVTSGLVGLVNEPIRDKPHYLVSASVHPGNSGGSAWIMRGGRYYMIGVPRAIAMMPAGLIAVPSPTHAFVIPLDTVRAFLEAHLPKGAR